MRNVLKQKLYIQKLITVTVLLAVILSSVSCSKKEEKSSEPVKEISKNTYRETQLLLPKNADSITDFSIQDSGKMRVSGSSENKACVWEADDSEGDWNIVFTAEDSPELSKISPYSIETVLSLQNEVVIQYYIEGEQEDETLRRDYLIRADYSIQELSTQENIYNEFKFSPNGNLFQIDDNGQIHLMDKTTGKIEKTYKREASQDQVVKILPMEDKLLTITEKQVVVYDINTGKRIKEDEKFKNLIANLKGKESSIGSYSMEDKLLFQADEEILSYDIKADSTELLLDMKDIALEKGFIYKLIPQDKNKFYIMELYATGQPAKIYQYTTGEESKVYDETLKVYTLEENKEMLRMLGRYRTMNPSIKVILEVGMTDGNGTKDDAIKQLNTRILAGDGPDVLIMDDLDIEKYIQQNLLTDMEESINKMDSENQLLTNIIKAYQTEKGLFAVPTRFSVPVISGHEKLLETFNGASDLTASIKKATKKEVTLGPQAYPDEMIGVCYYADVQNWISEQNKIDKEKVENFFKSVADIYKNGGYVKSEYEKQRKKNINPTANNLKGIYGNDAQLAFVEVNGWTDIEILSHIKNKKDMPYIGVGSSAEKVYIPKQITGILSGGSNQVGAMKFVTSLLSFDIQKTFDEPLAGDGLPVNELAMDYWLSRHHPYVEKGGFIFPNGRQAIEIDKMTNEEKTEWIDFIKGLNKPALTDFKLTQIVFTSGQDCIDGKISAKDAASKVVQYYELAESERE